MARTAAERSRDRRTANRSEDRWAHNLKQLASKNASALRSKGRNVQCVITIPEILEMGRRQSMRCHFTGVPFHLEGGKRHWAYPSLDRQDVDGDYSFENCRLTAWMWNRCRGDMSPEEFLAALHKSLYSFAVAPWHAEYHTLFAPTGVDNPKTIT